MGKQLSFQSLVPPSQWLIRDQSFPTLYEYYYHVLEPKLPNNFNSTLLLMALHDHGYDCHSCAMVSRFGAAGLYIIRYLYMFPIRRLTLNRRLPAFLLVTLPVYYTGPLSSQRARDSRDFRRSAIPQHDGSEGQQGSLSKAFSELHYLVLLLKGPLPQSPPLPLV
jgi:hypothetical protein